MSESLQTEVQELDLTGIPKVKGRRGTAWQSTAPFKAEDDKDDDNNNDEDDDFEPVVIVKQKDEKVEAEGKHLGEAIQVEADPELPPGETLEVVLSKHEMAAGERPLKSALKKDTLPKVRSPLLHHKGGLLHRQVSGADALARLKENSQQQAHKSRAPAAITAADLDLEKGIGKEGVLMFNALLTAARKDVGAPRAWGYKAPLFKVIVKAKNLISSGRISPEELEDLHEPLNRLGNLFLQLLNAKKVLKGEQNLIKPTLLATLIQDVLTKGQALLGPHLEAGELDKAQPAFDYYSDVNFVANFLNDPGYESEKRMMKQHARMMLKKLLKPQCAKPKCTTSRAKRQGTFSGSKLCARHHKERVESCYAPPGNFEHALEGDTSDFKLTFHDYLDRQDLKIGRIGPLFPSKRTVVPKSEADQDYSKEKEQEGEDGDDVPESSIVKAEPVQNDLEPAKGEVEQVIQEQPVNADVEAEKEPTVENVEAAPKEENGQNEPKQEANGSAESDAKPADSDAVPADSNVKPANFDAKPADSDSKSVEQVDESKPDSPGSPKAAEGENHDGGSPSSPKSPSLSAASSPTSSTRDLSGSIPLSPIPPALANSTLIQFLLHVKTFRDAVTVKERKKFGPVIYERYLTSNADREIHLLTKDPILMEPIHHAFEVGLAHIKPGLFNFCAQMIEKVLRAQFDHFVSSTPYQEALAEITLPEHIEKQLDGEAKEENEEDKLWESATKVTFSDEIQIVGFSDRGD